MKKYALRIIGVMAALLLAACSEQHSAAAVNSHVVRGSPSPSAPVELTYAMPERAPASEPFTLNLAITTPMESGSLQVEVTQQQNLTLSGAASRRIDLAAAARPIIVPLQIVPGAEAERFLLVSISVDTPMGPMSRSFRITLPGAEAVAPAGDAEHDQGMKILPAN